MSLFQKGLMRKPDKPALRKAIMKVDQAVKRNQLPDNCCFVIDGGALLHRVRWTKDASFDDICQVYAQYVNRHYSACFVVFDGYEGLSTKSNEHARRTGNGKKCADVDVVGCNKVPFPQDKFLSNEINKTSFIKLLASRLENDGNFIQICQGDADAAIVATSLVQAENSNRSIMTIADDTDIAMMLLYHWKSSHGEVILFQEKSNKGRKINEICNGCNLFREHILFIHAFSGCDTTSAPFGKGKLNFLSLVTKNKELQIVSQIMNDVWAEKDKVGRAAIKAFQII